jgi:retinol dehydrogenase 12
MHFFFQYSDKDPLNTFMGILGTLGSLSAVGTYFGYGKYIAGVLVPLTALAYMKAPSRSFPTADSIVDSSMDLSGKVAIVTGPTSGIGTETARILAARGAHVILAARNDAKLQATRSNLEKNLAETGIKGKFTTIQIDLNDLASVHNFVEEFKKLNVPLHLLINNAGVMRIPERRATKQGLEQQIGINHVGHFYLTCLLIDKLKASSTPESKSRVVCLSSVAFRLATESFFHADNTGLETTPYNPWVAYGNAKLSNMLFAREFHRRFSEEGIEACSVMPGGIHTGLQDHVSLWKSIKWRVVTPFFFKSIEQGAATTLYAALNVDLSLKVNGGQYFENCKTSTIANKMPQEACEFLWTATEAKLEELGFKL